MENGSATRKSGIEINDSTFDKPGTVLLESILQDEENEYSYLYTNPIAVLQCASSEMVRSCIEQIEQFTGRGFHAAGFISYEAGNAWTPCSFGKLSHAFPLLWFGIYRKVEVFDSPLILPASDHSMESIETRFNISSEDYHQSIRHILHQIHEGQTYQVNYTARQHFHWKHGAWQLYLRLRRSQPVPYGAFINCGKFSVVSLSPELFLKKRGETLQSRPMKGTVKRGSDQESDQEAAKWLQNDPKNLAENLMIVDLMRNDLGKIAVIGKVEVNKPFNVEPYRELFQMTTDVNCIMRKGVSLAEIFEATFPPGSVTGAPKVNTMRIISELEKSPRKVYTGTIGAFGPEGTMTMSVAIRTVICSESGSCEMGVGGGIVADSIPQDEFEEALLKGSFLNPSLTDRTDIFETILLQEDGSLLWFDEHLNRMENSSVKLGYPFSRKAAKTVVSEHLGKGVKGPAVLRLVLPKTGDIYVELMPLGGMPGQRGQRKAVILSRHQTSPTDVLLYHKTTQRDLYDRELSEARKKGYMEALFTNIHGHITEGAITNLFILGNDGWKTPDLRCGLLPGIWREKFLNITEAVSGNIYLDDLSTATSIVMGNSVRGALEIDEIVDAQEHTLYEKPLAEPNL